MIPKFRAWHIDKQIMCEVIRIDFKQGIVTLDLEPCDDEYYWTETDWKTSHVSFMQSTGLKDRNGVEIYEGDIITWESPEMTQSTWIGTVFRNGAEFSVRKSKKTYSTGAWLNSACRPTNNIITVIGDIHQNQELWEEER